MVLSKWSILPAKQEVVEQTLRQIQVVEPFFPKPDAPNLWNIQGKHGHILWVIPLCQDASHHQDYETCLVGDYYLLDFYNNM